MAGRRYFTPSVTKGTHGFDVPDGIIAHLTRECRGNVHDRKIVDVTCGSFEKEIEGASRGATNTVDLYTDSHFISAFLEKEEDIAHTRNNWVCHTLK
jgi:16S rRNA G966 N2-methylase RsmD